MFTLETLLEESEELPSLPEIYLRVSDLLEDDFSTAKEIGEAVQTDTSLTARLLKLVNSAYYGLPHQVSSITQTVSLLGRQQLHQILMGTVIAGIFSEDDIIDFPLREFWQHSIKTAIIARQLAMQNAHILDHEAFFTAGLLHDIGRLILAKVVPEVIAEVDARVAAGEGDVMTIENEILGLTHAEVGAALLKKWNMPSLLSQCVLKHHDIEHAGPFAIETCIVYLANQLSLNEPGEEEGDTLRQLASIPNWNVADCTLQQVHVACQLADEQWLEVMESLGMVDMEINDEQQDDYAYL